MWIFGKKTVPDNFSVKNNILTFKKGLSIEKIEKIIEETLFNTCNIQGFSFEKSEKIEPTLLETIREIISCNKLRSLFKEDEKNLERTGSSLKNHPRLIVQALYQS